MYVCVFVCMCIKTRDKGFPPPKKILNISISVVEKPIYQLPKQFLLNVFG